VVIFEIGVGPIETCRSMPYWDVAECVLFEPTSYYYEAIVTATSNRPNVKVHNVAIYDYNGEVEFIENSQISAIRGINSPQVQFGTPGGNQVIRPCAKLNEYDKGDIDLLLLDMEGSEWFALKHLVSRPKKIIVETQLTTVYRNPFLTEIEEWMKHNNYQKFSHIMADTTWAK